MKKYIFILVAFALIACERIKILDGTVIDFQSGDSIEGIDIGLYALNPENGYADLKWSDLVLIATATSNIDGFFSIKYDAEIGLNDRLFYFPLLPKDTLSENVRYTPYGSHNYGSNISDAINGMYKLKRSTSIQVKLINFTQKQIEMRFTDGAVRIHSLYYLANLDDKKLLAGRKYNLDFFEVVDFENNKKQLNYLGSTSHFIKAQLPEDDNMVDWLMPWQIIEIDYNILEKRLLDL